MDHGREAVRQLRASRPAGQLSPRPRDRRVDRGAAADDGRRENALLDSREACVQGTVTALRHARLRRRVDQNPVTDAVVYLARVAWTLSVTSTSSPTRNPPVSSAAFHDRPKSFRSRRMLASK